MGLIDVGCPRNPILLTYEKSFSYISGKVSIEIFLEKEIFFVIVLLEVVSVLEDDLKIQKGYSASTGDDEVRPSLLKRLSATQIHIH
ncbi:Hypothetical protein FKW44_002757, partial [Caligus rogercresseyi]